MSHGCGSQGCESRDGTVGIQGKELKAIFEPNSIAVIGASPNPDKIGHQILRNILGGGYAGRIYPIHPKAGEVCGTRPMPLSWMCRSRLILP